MSPSATDVRAAAPGLLSPASLFDAPERVVAVRGGAGTEFRVLDLARDVWALAARLPAVRGARTGVIVDDAYAMAVSLLALFLRGRVAVLPPNGESATLARLEPDPGPLLTDRPALGIAGVLDPLAPGGERPCEDERAFAELRAFPALDREAAACELFTSGTTGEGKATRKKLRHLADEVAMLENVFGAALDGATVLGSASPLHLYGLLFRVLWPLAARRRFEADTHLLPPELFSRTAGLDGFVLVSTPAHLRRLVRSDGLAALRARCRGVFSSGGPLDGETAEALAAALGEPAVEVYGSTETGGIALRRRRGRADDPAFTLLPGVSVTVDAGTGCALVASPFVSDGAEDAEGRARFLTGDAVTALPDRRIRLEGRVDRVVKVGEKRLSLPEMESRLREHPLVHDARLVVVERGGEPRVGAVIVPTLEGFETLAAGERRALRAPLLAHLAAAYDRVLLPRAFRFVRELPVDERGKEAGAAVLRALFEEGEAEPTRLPEIQEEVRGHDRIERRFRVPENLAHLPGHFPGRPVVPGVVTLSFALDAAAALLGREPELASIERLKFHAPLEPGDEAVLTVVLDRVSASLDLDVRSGTRRIASGRCRLGGGAA